jgi:hypothetical protein
VNRQHLATVAWVLAAIAALAIGSAKTAQRATSTKARVDSLSAVARRRLERSSIAQWDFRSSSQDRMEAAMSTTRWIVILIGDGDCAPCSQRKNSLRSELRAFPNTELWLITRRAEAQLPTPPDPNPNPIVRSLSFSARTSRPAEVDSLATPIVLLVDRNGIIHSASAGYRRGIDRDWLSELTRQGLFASSDLNIHTVEQSPPATELPDD